MCYKLDIKRPGRLNEKKNQLTMKKMKKKISKKSKGLATSYSTRTRRVYLWTLNRSGRHIQRRIGCLDLENEFLTSILFFFN